MIVAVLRGRPNRILDSSVLAVLMLFSFYLTTAAGERGFFPLDQSIVFDGSYRILSGQVPYKDFLIPFGPIVFWLQAIIFRLLGITYSSYVFGAAFINVLATACAVLTLRRLFPSRRTISYVAGLLTAVWFYPPFGTPWPEQTAFFFALAALTLLLPVTLADKPWSNGKGVLLALSGSLASLSILSKQNAGLLILPLYLLLLFAAFAPDSRAIIQRWVIFLTGFSGCILAFLLWLWAYADPSLFFQYFIQTPFTLGIDRVFTQRLGLLGTYATTGQAISTRWLLVTLFLLIVLVLAGFVLFQVFRNSAQSAQSWRPRLLSCIVCIYFVVIQYVLIFSSSNQPENALPFIGIISAIGIGFAFHLVDAKSMLIRTPKHRPLLVSRSTGKLLLAIGISITTFSLFALGVKVSLAREVQDVFSGSSFPRPLAVERLEGLRWGQPTRMWRGDIKGDDVVRIQEDDVVNLLNYLKAKKKNFLVFPDFTVLYALVGVPSPQPVLWFHKGLTYPLSYYLDLDKWIVDDLRKNTVEVVIIEEKSWFGTETRMNDFPLLKSYVAESFRRADRIGIFDIYAKKGKETD